MIVNFKLKMNSQKNCLANGQATFQKVNIFIPAMNKLTRQSVVNFWICNKMRLMALLESQDEQD